VIDLERALTDLAEHLDHPAGDDLVDAVRDRITRPVPIGVPARRRGRTLVAIAAVLLAIIAAVVAIAPARHAVADWLGIGAVEIRRVATPLPNGSSAVTVPGAPSTAAPDTAAREELAAARRAVGFTIATPPAGAAGALYGVDVDRRVRGGLVVLRYERFTVVEIASQVDGPTIGKILDPAAVVEPVTFAGRNGLWIEGAHQVSYFDRSGNLAIDTVRRSGPVMLWSEPATGVTYRIEGLPRLADALRVARTLR
jgi:hypothetical protein